MSPIEAAAPGAVIDRLVKEPSYQIDADHADCKTLIAAGPSSLRAIQEKVRAIADTWVSLYPAMAVVAEGLDKAGRDALAQLLAEAEAQHHGRLISFLHYAASRMTPALCESLCDRVERCCAESFGDAAAQFGERAIEIVIKRLVGESGEKAVALQEMLTAMFASSSFRDDKEWRAALKHADARVRAAAVAADLSSEQHKSVHALAADPDEGVRYAVVCHADALPVGTLLRLTQDPSPRVRAIATWQLSDDEPEVTAAYEKLLADPHDAVALMAAISLEHASCEERIRRALDGQDAVTRDCAARVLGFLPAEKYGAALERIEKSGTEDELAHAVTAAEDELPSLKYVAALARRDPPEKALRAAEIQLAYSDEEGVADLAASLLVKSAPDRVRRAGFYAVTPHREVWARHLEPLLRPDEPLLEDLINEIEGSLVGDEPVDRALFERLKRRYPDTVLDALATHALEKK